MRIAKPAVKADVVLFADFDETRGVLAVGTTCAPGLNLGVTLAYKLAADEARQLAEALTRWADAQP
jgi:hypothetical protein